MSLLIILFIPTCQEYSVISSGPSLAPLNCVLLVSLFTSNSADLLLDEFSPRESCSSCFYSLCCIKATYSRLHICYLEEKLAFN